MMVNLDNASSSVGLGLEDLLHVNNNNDPKNNTVEKVGLNTWTTK